jgi:hypothetical protein
LPFEATLQVYDAKPGAKRLWLIPGVGHAQEPVLAQDAEYVAQLGAFFHGVLPSPSPPRLDTAPITCDVVAQPDGAFTVQLRNPGLPGMVLLTIVHDTRVEFCPVWLSDVATLPHVIRHRPRQVSCLRLCTASGCGATARLCLSRRGQGYQEVFQPYIRSLSRLLHEGSLKELDTLLQALPQDRPEAPFDFFIGIYCVQIMQRTRYKLPHIARTAATAFCRYWHYGGQAAQRSLPTPWDLAAAILDTPVAPYSTPR